MNTVEKFDLVVKNGSVVLPVGVQRLDVGVRGEKIVTLAPDLSGGRRVIDAADKLVLPGLIDPHVHMGIPIKGMESADNFSSGSVAAAFGGTTTILDFTIQKAGQSLRHSLDARLAQARGKSHVDYGLHININKDSAEIPALIEAGFHSFKTFSAYKEAGMMMEWSQFRPALAQINDHGGILMLHAEDNALVEMATAKQIAAGHRAPIYHPRSRTSEAEAKAIERAARIAGEVGARLYIVHLSSKLGLEAGLRARQQGGDIILETCPQYLTLDESRYLAPNGHYWIATPPLRRPEDVDALWAGIADGQIDAIGTDHCPFTMAQKSAKDAVFYLTPNGLPGVENRLSLIYTYGVAAGRISLERMAALLAGDVARIFGLECKGEIAVGKDADLVVWDPLGESVVSAENLHGNCDWSPYEGMRQIGKLDYTVLRGKIIVAGEQLLGQRGDGELVSAEKKI